MLKSQNDQNSPEFTKSENMMRYTFEFEQLATLFGFQISIGHTKVSTIVAEIPS